MSIAQLIFRKGNFIEQIEVDVTIKESATANNKVTKNPVESGADMNDHIIIEPMSFTMVGAVSNVGGNIIEQTGNIAASALGAKSRGPATWEDLLRLRRDKKVFTLVQGIKSYENVTLLSLTQNTDKSTANALFFSASFTEVIFPGTTGDQATYTEQDVSDQAVKKITGGLKSLGV